MLVCCQICPTSLPELPLNINYATAVFSEADQNPHILSSVCYISLPVLTSLQRICPRPVPYAFDVYVSYSANCEAIDHVSMRSATGIIIEGNGRDVVVRKITSELDDM